MTIIYTYEYFRKTHYKNIHIFSTNDKIKPDDLYPLHFATLDNYIETIFAGNDFRQVRN